MEALYDILHIYSKELSSADYAQLKTALVRYVVPGWGGPKPEGARIRPEELDLGIQYLKTISAARLKEALKTQESVFEELGASKSSRRNYRYQLNRFINWAVANRFLASDDETLQEAETVEIRFRSGEQPKETALNYRTRLGVSRPRGNIIALKHIGADLNQQLADYKAFRLTHVREITVQADLQVLKRYLGWLAREKGIIEESIALDHGLPFVKLRYDEDDFADSVDPFMQAAIAEKKAFKRADEVAREVVEDFEKYRSLESQMRFRSAARIVTCLMNVVKWIYRHETKANFKDVPLYVRLGELKHRYAQAGKSEAPTVAYSLKSADWSDLPRVLEQLKREADAQKLHDGRPRPKIAIARSVQKLLIFAFFVAIPPRRNRVIAELELGRTLRRGRVDPRSGYIPESLLSSGEIAKWCITLSPEDYKTGKSYGSQSFEVNDMTFADGTTLYTYIARWIDEYRQLFNPVHNRLFVALNSNGKKKLAGRPISRATIYSTLTQATLRILGKPIAPKEFRKMFVSHISNRRDISEADLEAAARAMAHSRKMQMEVYDQVTSEARLATGMGLADRLW